MKKLIFVAWAALAFASGYARAQYHTDAYGAGSISGVAVGSSGGTTNTLMKFDSNDNAVDSTLSDSGTVVTATGQIAQTTHDPGATCSLAQHYVVPGGSGASDLIACWDGTADVSVDREGDMLVGGTLGVTGVTTLTGNLVVDTTTLYCEAANDFCVVGGTTREDTNTMLQVTSPNTTSRIVLTDASAVKMQLSTYAGNGYIGTKSNHPFDFISNDVARLSIAASGAATASTAWTFQSTVSAPKYSTATNCSSSASPAVCAAASAGSVVVAATATSVVVNTTAVSANSQIFVNFDSSLGTKLGVTCNTTTALPYVTARSTGVSFTLGIAVGPVTDPACYSYLVVN